MTDISIPERNQIRRDLEVLLRHARYDEKSKTRFMEFVSQNVTPFVNGNIDSEGNPIWKSFMTDDFSPVEYSWAWKSKPHVRFSFEPIGSQLSKRIDPANREEPMECVSHMRDTVRSADWTLFDCFEETLLTQDLSDGFEDSERDSDPSSVFLAAESKPGGAAPVIKAYFSTEAAEAAGVDPLTSIEDAFHEMEGEPTPDVALSCFVEYLRQREMSSPIQIILAAVDCVEVARARTKIYFRTHDTSFQSVRSILSMDGKLDEWGSKSILELKEMWYAVLDLASDFPETQDLPQVDHETSGILYYASMTPTKSTPSMKVYIPVKHYGTNDQKIAEGLVDRLEKKGGVPYARSFLNMLQELSDHRRLDESRGMQTYISVGLQGGELDITSYFSPELYHPERLRKLRCDSCDVVNNLVEEGGMEAKL